VSSRHICFSHGSESGPWGTKIRALADVARSKGWTVESLDYQGMEDPHARAAKLKAYCRARREPVALAGSSMGGFVATAAAAEVPAHGHFLMEPAFYVPGRDDVVPWEGSVRYAARCRARLALIDGDHRLTANLAEVSEFFRMFLEELDV
jgi:pimeloyl-ACP methyl ester carboxylesterase